MGGKEDNCNWTIYFFNEGQEYYVREGFLKEDTKPVVCKLKKYIYMTYTYIFIHIMWLNKIIEILPMTSKPRKKIRYVSAQHKERGPKSK